MPTPRPVVDPRSAARHRPMPLWPWVLFAMLGLCVTMPRPRTGPMPAAPAVGPQTPAGTPGPAPTVAPAAAAAVDASRQAVAAPPLTFADYVERLVAIGFETSRLHAARDRPG